MNVGPLGSVIFKNKKHQKPTGVPALGLKRPCKKHIAVSGKAQFELTSTDSNPTFLTMQRLSISGPICLFTCWKPNQRRPEFCSATWPRDSGSYGLNLPFSKMRLSGRFPMICTNKATRVDLAQSTYLFTLFAPVSSSVK